MQIFQVEQLEKDLGQCQNRICTSHSYRLYFRMFQKLLNVHFEWQSFL